MASRWHARARPSPLHRLSPDLPCEAPFAKVPSLEDDSLIDPAGGPLRLSESEAILLHLAEHYGSELDGPPEQAAVRRAKLTQWLLFANATLAVALFVPSNREREFPRLMGVLDGLLAGGQPLVGEQWGAADCAVGLPCLSPHLLPPDRSRTLAGGAGGNRQRPGKPRLPAGNGQPVKAPPGSTTPFTWAGETLELRAERAASRGWGACKHPATSV